MAKFRSLELDRLTRNFHFWIIIAIIAAISILYYEWKDWFPWFWHVYFFEFKNNILGTLFLIPFLYASLVFWWRGSLIAWFLSISAIMPRLIHVYYPDVGLLLRSIAFLIFPLTIVLIITLELNWRQKQKEITREREEERQVYLSQIFRSQEDERRRIAQELHDDTTQELLIVANHAQTLVSNADSMSTGQIKKKAEWMRDVLLQISENVRRLSLDLRPSILDNVGLVSALRWLADRLTQDSKINTKVVVNGVARKLHLEAEVNIFRIVQEALNNVRRHSNANEAVVTLKFAPESIKITIRDNGNGFSLTEKLGSLSTNNKLGIIGIEQRARFFNGTFDVQSQIGKGTLVLVEMVV